MEGFTFEHKWEWLDCQVLELAPEYRSTEFWLLHAVIDVAQCLDGLYELPKEEQQWFIEWVDYCVEFLHALQEEDHPYLENWDVDYQLTILHTCVANLTNNNG